jgi:predicted dinucleotide-utilizing enzyme
MNIGVIGTGDIGAVIVKKLRDACIATINIPHPATINFPQ